MSTNVTWIADGTTLLVWRKTKYFCNDVTCGESLEKKHLDENLLRGNYLTVKQFRINKAVNKIVLCGVH